MEERINVDLDFGVLVGESYHAWDGIGNYIITDDAPPSSGRVKLRVRLDPFFDLGTIEIRKVNSGSLVVFSDVMIFENDIKILINEELDNMEGSAKEKADQVGDLIARKLPKANDLQAKKQQWQEAKKIYKKMLEKLIQEEKAGTIPTAKIEHDTAEAQKLPRVPKGKSAKRRWINIYNLVRHKVDSYKNIESLTSWYNSSRNPKPIYEKYEKDGKKETRGMTISVDTMTDIIKAGEAGLLDLPENS